MVVLAGPGHVTVVTSCLDDSFAMIPAEQLDRVDRLGLDRLAAAHIERLGSFDVGDAFAAAEILQIW